ncbi:BQ2448_236 [Microbotryum intermedium]|uniref:BQ2448_236 protein n=1 Tax=Microbotryum intermedium TaxID=269621 RepID=A0A238F500_9BASI|nr:BQ2448_236 [Microbotryum intermedium]
MEYKVLGEHKHLGSVNTWRAFVWIPISMHAFFVTWASTQAFIVVSARSRSEVTRTGRRGYVSAKVANALFYGMTVAFTGGLLIVDTLCAIAWRRTWSRVVALRSALRRYQAAYVPPQGIEFMELLNVQSLHVDLEISAAKSRPYQNAVVLMVIIVPLTIGLVSRRRARNQLRCRLGRSRIHPSQLNIGSIGLLLTLRRQINASIRRRSIRPHVGFATLVATDCTGAPTHLAAFPARATPFGSESQGVRDSAGLQRTSPAQRFSTSLMALTPSSFGGFSAKHNDGPAPKSHGIPLSPGLSIDLGGNVDMNDLRRAEKDLIVCVAVIVTFSLSFTAENIWNYICILPNDAPRLSETELSYFFVPWVYSIIYSIGCTALVLNLSVRRSRSRWQGPEVPTSSSSSFEHGSCPPAAPILPDGCGLGMGDLSQDEGKLKHRHFCNQADPHRA